ncbi:MAG: hypothetical protein AABY33_00135 [Pseudomonadota bacterium]
MSRDDDKHETKLPHYVLAAAGGALGMVGGCTAAVNTQEPFTKYEHNPEVEAAGHVAHLPNHRELSDAELQYEYHRQKEAIEKQRAETKEKELGKRSSDGLPKVFGGAAAGALLGSAVSGVLRRREENGTGQGQERT